ncbi:sialidase family protein [Antarctobacter heliothermus]|nr:sialidase family protein [Antarctobacter heliothermus]
MLFATIISVSGWQAAFAQTAPPLFDFIEEVALPVGPDAHEPSIAQHDGRLYLSWMERSLDQTVVMMAIRDDQQWSEPRIVYQSADLFVNWADHPGIAVFANGTIAVHWLREIGPSSFDYQIEIALSADGGVSWTDPLIPHDDRTLAQHGFASMVPVGPDELTVIWLDGRAYGRDAETGSGFPDAMQLRATTLTDNGITGPDVWVDLQTCSCCQTSITSTASGAILAAYRDRTDGEIRDISVARLEDGKWHPPVSVHRDGWELAGCPVNGPAISAEGNSVAVAWFTGAQETAVVNVAFSNDAGISFEDTARIDLGSPVGRVDLEMLEDGTAIVSWVEWSDTGEALMLCRVQQGAGCTARETLAINIAGASINFPKLAKLDRDIYVVWTQPVDAGDTLAMRRATFARKD